ncbi:MAG: CopG family transcriptional regulator [Thermoleophilaceae bacterium]|nr:CopG family transcriptional regulator [Thermoleophilaceae bacterium]
MIDHRLTKKGPAERGAFLHEQLIAVVGFKFCFPELRHLAVTGRVQLKSLPKSSDIVIDMRTISLAVSEKNYELFRELAQTEDRSIASLIRDAMAEYIARTGAQPAGEQPGTTVVQQLLPGPGRYRIYAEVSEAE